MAGQLSIVQRCSNLVAKFVTPTTSSPKFAMGVTAPIQLEIPVLVRICALFVAVRDAAVAKALSTEEAGIVVGHLSAFADAVFVSKFLRFNTDSRNDLLNEVMTTRRVRVLNADGTLGYKSEPAPFRQAQLALRESYPGIWVNPNAPISTQQADELGI